MIFLLLYWLLKKEVEKKLTSKWGLIFKFFGRNETKGSCVDMWIVINRNKIAYKNSIGAQDGQKQDCVKITSAEEELITISCEVVQGNVNFVPDLISDHMNNLIDLVILRTRFIDSPEKDVSWCNQLTYNKSSDR